MDYICKLLFLGWPTKRPTQLERMILSAKDRKIREKRSRKTIIGLPTFSNYLQLVIRCFQWNLSVKNEEHPRFDLLFLLLMCLIWNFQSRIQSRRQVKQICFLDRWNLGRLDCFLVVFWIRFILIVFPKQKSEAVCILRSLFLNSYDLPPYFCNNYYIIRIYG